MRLVTALLVLTCIVSLSPGQYVETTILLPDSLSGLTNVGSLVYHSPNSMIYVGGDTSFLVAVDALTNAKVKKVAVGEGPHVLCSDPAGNKVYCANGDATVAVIDGATSEPAKTIPVERVVADLVYNEQENKLYCGSTNDSFVRVVDCAGDSLVARVPVSLGPGALCYNPQLNRIYCAHPDRDEVTVIDCVADTVIATVWVRGVEPLDISYDSASNCVYTANATSNTVTVIDCVSDTIVRLLPAGRRPEFVVVGPPGKVYCSNFYDNSITVISGTGVKTVQTCPYPWFLSYDQVNNKVYCASDDQPLVTVIDAGKDTALANVETGSYSAPPVLCCNPVGNNTYAAGANDGNVAAIGGESDTVETVIALGASQPGALCYNSTENRLYCLDRQTHLLFIVDGDSNRVVKTIKTSSYAELLVWNPASDKVYFPDGDAVSVVDCLSDSIVATVATGQYPYALCCGDDGKVYVADFYGGVTVMDGWGDSVRAFVPIRGSLRALCYDRADNKVYVGRGSEDSMGVIDAASDSLLPAIPVPYSGGAAVCWNPNHDKLYVGGPYNESLVVVDCTSDTILRKARVPMGTDGLYCDSVCDKIYGVDSWDGYLRVIAATTDSLTRNLSVGSGSAILDNGKQGPANRLYFADEYGDTVTVIGGYKTDSILKRIAVGDRPSALAWNPTYSRIYVSNYGSSSITVIRDTIGVGVEEGRPQASSRTAQATVVRGILILPGLGTRSELPERNSVMSRATLLDISGRKVMDLRPGANDVQALAPGVYFVHSTLDNRQSTMTKVVVAR